MATIAHIHSLPKKQSRWTQEAAPKVQGKAMAKEELLIDETKCGKHLVAGGQQKADAICECGPRKLIVIGLAARGRKQNQVLSANWSYLVQKFCSEDRGGIRGLTEPISVFQSGPFKADRLD